MIFEFSNYRDWLLNELTQRTLDNPLFSGNAFAKKLGISQSYFSSILTRARPLTEKKAFLVGEKLKLTRAELEYLILLIKKEKAKDDLVGKFLDSEISRFRKANRLEQIDLESFKIISDWYYSALLELIVIKEIPHTARALSKRLGLNEEIINQALKRLLRLNLIKREGRHYVRKDDSGLTTPADEVLSEGLRKFHKDILQKASEAIIKQKVEDRHFSGMTMAINPEKLPIAKKRIEAFKNEIADSLETGNKSKVYQLAIQLFRLDRENGEDND